MNAPTTCLRIDNAQAPAAKQFTVVTPDRSFKPRTFVDDLDQQPVFIEPSPERDRALTVHDRVGDQLTDQQPRAVKLFAAQPGR